jgi:hypothetical protein
MKALLDSNSSISSFLHKIKGKESHLHQTQNNEEPITK